MIARTSCSSTSCLAKERAFSALPCESFMKSSIFLPPIPPAALASSTSICMVLDSGRPRLAAGPVIAKMAPILMAPVSAAKLEAVRSAARPRQRTSFLLDMTFSLEMRELNIYTYKWIFCRLSRTRQRRDSRIGVGVHVRFACFRAVLPESLGPVQGAICTRNEQLRGNGLIRAR